MKLQVVTIVVCTETYDLRYEESWKGTTLKERISEGAYDTMEIQSRTVQSASISIPPHDKGND